MNDSTTAELTPEDLIELDRIAAELVKRQAAIDADQERIEMYAPALGTVAVEHHLPPAALAGFQDEGNPTVEVKRP